MRIAKKIIFVVLAILPVFTLFQLCLLSANDKPNIGVDQLADMPPITYVVDDDMVIVQTFYTSEGDSAALTLMDVILMPFIDFNSDIVLYRLTGLPADFFSFIVLLNESVGVPICGSTFGSFMLLTYYAFLGLAEMIVDLITFVPRKVSEIFK